MVMFCSGCGSENIFRQRYCRRCGTPFVDTDKLSGRETRPLTAPFDFAPAKPSIQQMLRNLSLSFVFMIFMAVTLFLGHTWPDALLFIFTLGLCVAQFRRFQSRCRELTEVIAPPRSVQPVDSTAARNNVPLTHAELAASLNVDQRTLHAS